eukprot:scaffold3734_cov425-Prasinococcus_capsulatus_cf.AAC.4
MLTNGVPSSRKQQTGGYNTYGGGYRGRDEDGMGGGYVRDGGYNVSRGGQSYGNNVDSWNQRY